MRRNHLDLVAELESEVVSETPQPGGYTNLRCRTCRWRGPHSTALDLTRVCPHCHVYGLEDTPVAVERETSRAVFEALLSEWAANRKLDPTDRELPERIAQERADWLARLDAAEPPAEVVYLSNAAAPAAEIAARAHAFVSAADGWISVEERLPGIGEDVLLAAHHRKNPAERRHMVASIEWPGGSWQSETLYLGDWTITHWRPLPEPPT